MEKGSVDQITLGEEFCLSCRSTKTFTKKKERVQLFKQLAAYKFIFAYNRFEIPD